MKIKKKMKLKGLKLLKVNNLIYILQLNKIIINYYEWNLNWLIELFNKFILIKIKLNN